jgi:processive 1,2-diacylglycerol beta-glucosyltransferase
MMITTWRMFARAAPNRPSAAAPAAVTTASPTTRAARESEARSRFPTSNLRFSPPAAAVCPTAQALERAFAKVGGAGEVRDVEALQFTNAVFRQLCAQAYIELANDKPDTRLALRLRRAALGEGAPPARARQAEHTAVREDALAVPAGRRHLHALPARRDPILAEGEGASRLPAGHRRHMWICHHFEHYFVAIDETREHLVKLGIPADKVSVSGIPIDPLVAEAKDKPRAARKARPPAGRDGRALLSRRVRCRAGRAVGSRLELCHPADVVVVCGRNAELQQLARATEKIDRPRRPGAHARERPAPGASVRRRERSAAAR